MTDLGVDTRALVHGAGRIDAAALRWDGVLASAVTHLATAAEATGSGDLQAALRGLGEQIAAARRTVVASVQAQARHVAVSAHSYERTDAGLAGEVPDPGGAP